jgi:hypothetical protein
MFKKLNVELERRADEDKYAKEVRDNSVEEFKVELELQIATINSEILKQKREVAKVETSKESAIYMLVPNLELFDERNAELKKAEKKLAQWEDLLEVRKTMLAEMV